MKKNLLAISLLACLSAAGAAQASNLAAGLPSASYSQSGGWAGYDAQSLFNGNFWNNGNFGDGWAQVDLMASKNIAGVSYYTNQLPNGEVWQQVYVSDSAIGNNWTSLTPVASFHGYASDGTLIKLDFSGVSGRYVEIVANGGPSWTALRDATVSAVPEPSSYAMLMLGLGLTGWMARRRKV